jgi:hypothetical protein
MGVVLPLPKLRPGQIALNFLCSRAREAERGRRLIGETRARASVALTSGRSTRNRRLVSTCVCDPSRLYQRGGQEQLELIASTGDNSWLRCKQCERWLWLMDDSSKFQAFGTWELDAELAARAARERSLDVVLDLLLSHNLPHGLPYGPCWELPEALISAARELAPGVDSRALLAALEQRTKLPERWRAALDSLRAEGASDAVTLAAIEYPFSIDRRLDLTGVEVVEETRSGLLLARLEPRCRVFEVTPRGIEHRDLPGPAHYVGQADGELLLQVELDAGRSLLRVGGDGVWSTAACPRTACLAAHDAEYWFLASPTASGSRLEVRRRDCSEVAALDVRGAAQQLHPASPVRFGDSWIIPNAVLEAGRAAAFALWHPNRGLGLAAPALARPVPGLIVESVLVVGDVVVTRSRARIRDRVDLWCVAPDRIEHVASYGEIRSIVLAGEVLVLATLTAGKRFVSKLRGVGLDGAQLWDMQIDDKVEIWGAGRGVLATWGSQAIAIDASSGRVERELRADVATPDFADKTGTEYHAGRTLRLVRDREVTVELPLDGVYEVVTTLGDAAVLELGARLDDDDDDDDDSPSGYYLVVSREGEVRGRFVAQDPQWSVSGTVGGPYVVEADRLRIGALGSDGPRLE